MISFDPGEDLIAIRDTVRRFAQEEIRPHMRDWEEAGQLPSSLETAYLELGLNLLTLPEASGGMGLGMRAVAVVQEELAWGDIGVATGLPGLELIQWAVELMGEESQRTLISTDSLSQRGCIALLESPPGFMLKDTWTFAEENAEGASLFGQKAFSLNAGQANWSLIVAQTRPGEGLVGLKGFLVEGSPDGMAGGARHHLLGLHTAYFGELDLSGCYVPASHILAGRGHFARALDRWLDRLRILTAARIVGACRAAADHAFRYSTEREAFGQVLCDHQGISFMIADMATQLDVCRWLVWRGAWAMDSGQSDAHRHVAMAFQRTIELSELITCNAVQILGGHGYIQDHPVEKWMRDVRVAAIIGGLDGFMAHDVTNTELGVSEIGLFDDGLTGAGVGSNPAMTTMGGAA